MLWIPVARVQYKSTFTKRNTNQLNPNAYQLGEQSVFMGNDKARVRLHTGCSNDMPRETTDATALMLSMISPIPIKERNSL